MDNNQVPLKISIEQSKLLGNALRIKIISLLLNKPRTAKQVSDQLGNSPGNVHYHIKKLYEGGLIELVETKEVGGIIEKYYKAKSKWFNSGVIIDPALNEDFNSTFSDSLSLRLFLKEEEREEFIEDVKNLLEKWVNNSDTRELSKAQEYAIGFKLVASETEKGD
ncbi:ArsR/SmtB family transcription factor [Oceanobacillus damuensis]|uniref:ArsR/SmtB family transcription factor n=1 Tax=Oceanobacillus damuensis TaxID=937928 RepID=UPI000835D6E3|nr:winged helix-turn-helix domain-containing protein [Oceanobacillus damuensis]